MGGGGEEGGGEGKLSLESRGLGGCSRGSVRCTGLEARRPFVLRLRGCDSAKRGGGHGEGHPNVYANRPQQTSAAAAAAAAPSPTTTAAAASATAYVLRLGTRWSISVNPATTAKAQGLRGASVVGGGGLFFANASESARSWDWPVTALAASVGRAPLALLGAATGCIAPRPLPVCWSAAGAPLHNYPTPPPSPPPPLPTSPLLPFFSLSCLSGSRGRRLWWWWPQWTMTGAAGSGTWQRRFVGCLVVVHLSHAQAVQTRRRWLASPRVCAMGPLGDRGCSFLSARVGC